MICARSIVGLHQRACVRNHPFPISDWSVWLQEFGCRQFASSLFLCSSMLSPGRVQHQVFADSHTVSVPASSVSRIPSGFAFSCVRPRLGESLPYKKLLNYIQNQEATRVAENTHKKKLLRLYEFLHQSMQKSSQSGKSSMKRTVPNQIHE